MKKTVIKITFIVLLLTSINVIAQEKAETAIGQPSAAEMNAWEKYMALGEMHALLAASDGEWKEELLFWQAPGTEPQKNSATCVNTMILGGRFQESNHKGTVMGMPFEGKGLVGYDNIKKIFMSTWVDNMGTGIMYSEGPYDPKTQSITMKGKMMDPMAGKEQNVRQVFTFVNDKQQKFEMFVMQNGKEFKTMQINYQR